MTSPFLYLFTLALTEGDLRAVRELVRKTLATEARTLEMGCGPGLFSDLFAAGDYVGVDPRPRFVDYARRERPGAFICDELRSVGLPDARFDQAVALDLLGPRQRIPGPGDHGRGQASARPRGARASRRASGERRAGRPSRFERRLDLAARAAPQRLS